MWEEDRLETLSLLSRGEETAPGDDSLTHNHYNNNILVITTNSVHTSIYKLMEHTTSAHKPRDCNS